MSWLSLEVSCRKGKDGEDICDENADMGSMSAKVDVGESAPSGEDFKAFSSCVNQAWEAYIRKQRTGSVDWPTYDTSIEAA